MWVCACNKGGSESCAQGAALKVEVLENGRRELRTSLMNFSTRERLTLLPATR
jgi:hypothetical protein